MQQIIGALVSEQLVISGAKGVGVRLGPVFGSLAEAVRYSIVDRCRSVLTEVTKETVETTDLSVLRGNDMIFLDQVPGLYRLRTASFVGEVFPLTTTANGRACPAQLPEGMAQRLIEGEWSRNDQNGDIASILAELRTMRARGLACDFVGHTSGISAVGFAFKDWGGDLRAISVPVPSSRFKDARATVETALQKAVGTIDNMMANKGMVWNARHPM